MEQKNKIFIDWEQYGLDIDVLTKKIMTSTHKFDGVYGIPRGGCPIAVAVSHKLNIPLVKEPTTDTLIVDDISDTGKTLLDYKQFHTATLYVTPWTAKLPDFNVSKIKSDKNDWVVFPYE